MYGRMLQASRMATIGELAAGGLGLAISNTVARAHGGSLTYRPNTPAGACFAIRIRAEP